MFLLFHFWCAHTLTHTRTRARGVVVSLASCPLAALLSRLGSSAVQQLISSLSVWPNDQRLMKVSSVGWLMRGSCCCLRVCVLMGAARPEQRRATCQGSPTTNRNTSWPQRFSPVSSVEAPCECSSIQHPAHVRNRWALFDATRGSFETLFVKN